MAKILGGAIGENAALARSFLMRDAFEHDATVAHYFDRGTLVGDKLFVDTAVLRLFASVPPALWESASRIDNGVLASCYTGARWFGHYVHDELPLRCLAESIGTPFVHGRPRYAHEDDYERALQIRPAHAGRVLCVDGCVVLDDHSQNSDKQRRYRELRARLNPERVPGRRVYLRRTGGAERTMTNEAELLEALCRDGFTSIDTGSPDLGPIAEALRGAETVVGVDGSHCAVALLFAADGASITSILPPARSTSTLTDIGTVIGHDMGVFVADAGPTAQRFSVDIDEFRAFLAGEHGATQVSLASVTAPLDTQTSESALSR